MDNARELLVDEIVNEVMSQANNLAESCGCGGCQPELPPPPPGGLA
jgi:hypothetical protein